MTPYNSTHLLTKLRQLMKNPLHVPKILNAYIIPSEDAHQSEYTAKCDRRRAFICGFSGSMGTAVVLDSKAALWTDGRYYLQAEREMDSNWTLMKRGLPSTPKEAEWIIQQFKQLQTADSGSNSVKNGCLEESLVALESKTRELSQNNNFVVGADPCLMDNKTWLELSTTLSGSGHELVAVETNLVDLVWGEERPARPSNPVTVLESKWTGQNLKDKLQIFREKIKNEDCSSLVLTALDDIAYLFNLRGNDIPFNPVFFSYAILTMNEAMIFIDESKLTENAKTSLEDCFVQVLPYDQLLPSLKKICDELPTGQHIWLPNTCSHAVARTVPESKRILRCSPVALAKAIKNDTEAAGIEACHVRDGAAVCSFLAWLGEEVPKGAQTELSASNYLEQCRAKQDHYCGLSFETISAVGSNAAIVHYSSSADTDRTVTDHEIYLVDSGGHYFDGTTDVTRTVHFGLPSPEVKDAFTRVLKGHIALSTIVFPSKIKGNCLDSFARQFLWAVGLDYGHGTSHGIGAYNNVHEGPMGISWRVYPDDPGLQAGMFLSNEPGYYKAGEYGIRIENIVRVVKADTPNRHNDNDFLTFKNTTLVPIQTKLIDTSLLTKREVAWVNEYHNLVREKVGNLLKSQGEQKAYEWLLKETAPIEML